MTIEIVIGADAFANLAEQPANVLLYGPPGSQKTTDAVQAFCKDGKCSAFVISCEDGALKPILARGLPVPDHPRRPVKTWGEMQEVMEWLGKNRQRYSACIIDTLSTFSMYLYREVESTIKSKNKFDIPIMMRNMLFYLREWIRSIGLHSVLICHQMEPTVKDGVLFPGAPLLAPKSLAEVYFGLLDTVLRVDYIDIPGVGRQRVYWTGGQTWPAEVPNLAQPMGWQNWRAKNREGCAAMIVPAGLREFLLARKPPYPGL